MKMQVLVSTMNQKGFELVERMNISTDTIIINQCDEYKFEEIEYKKCNIKMYSFDERGVGLSRNSALMRADGDICLFADDDVVYNDNYEKIILKAFEENKKADVIVFNVPSSDIKRPTYNIIKNKKVNRLNCLRYGAFTIAVKRNKVLQSNVTFSLLFGGGAKYLAGEDSLFLYDCIKNKLNVYSCKEVIGMVNHKESTWFEGYNDRFFFDKGVFFSFLNKKIAYILCIQFALRKYKIYKKDKTLYEAIKLMFLGAKSVIGDNNE